MTRLWAFALGAALLLAGCGGETFVEYSGSVVAASAPGHSFDAEANPAGLPPIAGAEVVFSVCAGSCPRGAAGQRLSTDAAGQWGPFVETFGGAFGNHEIQITVTAPGYAPYGYATVYETTADPTAGDLYLNIALAPE